MNRAEKITLAALAVMVAAVLWPVFRALAEDPSTVSGGVVKWGLGHPNSTADNTHLTALSTNVVKITENSNWVLAQSKDGTLKAWGNNTYGQTNAPSGTWTNSFAGWRHGIAVRPDGSIHEWGTPYGNAIADWTNLWPQAMIDGFTTNPIIQVAAGDDHSLALSSNGTVYAWGGRAEVTNYSTGGAEAEITTATMIDSGWYAGIALLSDGTVQTFGTISQAGQYIEPPTALTDGSVNVVYVGASQWGFYAIDDAGNPYGWGMPDTYGQFTFGAEATNIVSISGGIRHTIMARDDGTVLTYGSDANGQVTIPGTLTNSLWVVGGRYTSFAIQTDTVGESEGGSATNYYVKKTGSDSNAGTEASPFLTIQKGLDTALTSGNQVIVSVGDYPEYATTKASGVTLTAAGDGDVTLRAIRVNNHTNITLSDLIFEKVQASGVTWPSAIRVEAGAHNLTLDNVTVRSPVRLSRTNWTFNSTSNSIYSASGSDWAAAGFEVGGKIRTGAASIEPYIFANMDQNFTILGITNDALYTVESLTAETNSTWSMIYASPSTHEGIQGVDMIVSGSTSATNLIINGGSFETFGIALDLQGPGPVTVTDTRVNSHAWAGIRANASQLTVSGSFFTGTNFIFYSEREQNDVPHDGSPDQYDFRQGYIRSDGTTGTGVVFNRNWFQHIDNPLGQIGTGAYGTNWTFSSNVVVGVMKQWDGLSRLVNANFYNNTFYRVSFDSEGGSTGHALTHSGASGSILATNHVSLRNVFVDIGDHSSTNAEGFYANANLSGGTFDSNFVASAESMGWAGKAIFSESNGINGGNPLFVDQHDPLGPDGLPFTADDGLRPLPTSPIAIHGLGALDPVSVTTDTPIAHFNLTPASFGWLDQTGTNFNTAWEVDPPFSRSGFVRPWTTAEAIGEVPLEILSDASDSISGDWFQDSFKGIKRFNWNWGDGASDLRPMQSPTNSHVFLRDGSFTVALTTENFAGNTASVERDYRILPVDSFTGDIWHVKTNGNDTTGTGTYAAPYLTISKAHSVAADGDYIAVHAGQYAEDLDMNRNVATTRIAIHGFGAQTDRFRLRHSNWTIWGFDIDNTSDGQGGIYIFQASDGGHFVNNKFHDIDAGGLAGGFYGAGTAGNPMDNSLNVRIIGNWFTNVLEPQIQIFGGSNWLVSANYAENSDGEGDFIRPRGAWHTIQDNYVYNMNNGGGGGHPDFIQLDDQSGTGYWWLNLLVQRNWVEGDPTITDASDYAMGQIETGAFGDQTSYTNMVLRNNVFRNVRATFSDSNDGMKFFNNTFYIAPRESPNITSGGGVRGSSWGTRYTNNVFFQISSNSGVSASTGWYYRSTGTGNPGSNTTTYANYNLVYPAKTSGLWTENSNEANGINGSDPLFVDASAGLLMLATNSPAYGTGVAMSGNAGLDDYTDDFWGETRTVWSIGAFEFSTLGQVEGGGGGGAAQPAAVLSGRATISGAVRLGP